MDTRLNDTLRSIKESMAKINESDWPEDLVHMKYLFQKSPTANDDWDGRKESVRRFYCHKTRNIFARTYVPRRQFLVFCEIKILVPYKFRIFKLF